MELQEHLVMWAGSVLYVAFTIIRRRSSRRTREATTELDYTESKRGIDYLRLLIGYEVLTYALYVVDVNVDPARMFFQLPFPWWLRWTGVALFAAADALFFQVHRHLGANFYANLKLRRGHELVTTGPYRLVRHPMYLGLYLNHVGVFLLTANWLIGVTWLVAFTAIMIYRLPREEAMMLGRFGRDYEAWRERTGRFLPALAALRRARRNEA
jgi:protein-S-isoprenylcysteine O-methyltransferase Ste14